MDLSRRVEELEETVQHHAAVLERIAADVSRHETAARESEAFIAAQRGAWQMVQRAGIVIAALASLVTMAMKVVEAVAVHKV